MGRVIDNPRTGERIVIRRNDPERLEFDVFLQPGGHVPAGHLHPRQEERFAVIDGDISFRLGRRRFRLAAGQEVVVPERTSHWFGNAGPSVAQVRVKVRPALRMEELFETSASRTRLHELALLLLEFCDEVRPPLVPGFVVSALAWLHARFSR